MKGPFSSLSLFCGRPHCMLIKHTNVLLPSCLLYSTLYGVPQTANDFLRDVCSSAQRPADKDIDMSNNCPKLLKHITISRELVEVGLEAEHLLLVWMCDQNITISRELVELVEVVQLLML